MTLLTKRVRNNPSYLQKPGSATNKIASITPSGVFTEFPVPTADSNPWTIAWGPDGNVWFTEYVVNKIGRLAVPSAAAQ